MQIKNLFPEINEDGIIILLKGYIDYLPTETKRRLKELHKQLDIEYAILEEYNLIQEKKSHLTFGQRKQIEGIISLCLIRLSKGDKSKDDLEKEIMDNIVDGTNSSNN